MNSKVFFILKYFGIPFCQILCMNLVTEGLYAQHLKLRIYGMPQRTFMYENKKEKEDIIEMVQDLWPNENFKITHLPSYNVGFGFQLKNYITERSAIDYGLQYSPIIQKYSYHIVVSEIKNEGSIILNYLKLPILFEYDIISREKFKLFTSVGPQFSLLTSDLGAIPVYFFDLIEQGGVGNYFSFDLINAGSAYKKFTFDGVIAIGAEKKIAKSISIFLQPRFDCSLTRVNKKNVQNINYFSSYKIFDDSNITLKSNRNISIGLQIGLSFDIR